MAPFPAAAADADKARLEAAWEKLTILITRHPMAEVRERLYGMIRTRQLRVTIVTDEEDAAFSYGNDAAVVDYEERPGCGLCPVLSVGMTFLLREGVPDEWRLLVLWHEAIHVREAESGLAPWIKHLPLPVDWPRTDAHIEGLMRSELQAYRSEYELAASLGWDSYDPLGDAYRWHGPAAMACKLAEDMERVPIYMGHEDTVRRVAEEFAGKGGPVATP